MPRSVEQNTQQARRDCLSRKQRTNQRKNPAMTLVLRTMKTHMGWDDAKDDYVVLDRGKSVGRIYKVHSEARWSWSVNTSPFPAPPPNNGLAGSREEAKQQFKQRYEEMKAQGVRPFPMANGWLTSYARNHMRPFFQKAFFKLFGENLEVGGLRARGPGPRDVGTEGSPGPAMVEFAAACVRRARRDHRGCSVRLPSVRRSVMQPFIFDLRLVNSARPPARDSVAVSAW